jgi:hypothetical protein
VRVTLDAGDEVELRPAIFGMARERGWTLWELHRERASLEQLFRSLTAEGPTGGAPVEEGAGALQGSADGTEVTA